VLDVEAMTSVAASRAALLAEIGDAPELTFIRGHGNIGDELIWEGTRQLLAGHVYREIGVDELGSARGDTALLTGGGAFSREYNEFMPEALAVAEQCYDRVILLPSSFDVSVDRVRDALLGTGAVIYAREPESYARIAGLCRARLAHDSAFYFDFTPYQCDGEGTLHAFRTDRERAGSDPLPEDNDDISASCASLDDWLATIARHEIVRTDRAHVMIAAALLGKRVEYAPNSYHKVEAIARGALSAYPVQPVSGEQARPTRRLAPAVAAAARFRSARVSAVVLTTDRPEPARRAVASVAAADADVHIVLAGQNPSLATREALLATAEAEPAVELRLSDRDVGCVGGRALAIERTDGEYVLFLDDDAELQPGALEHMIADLDAHPEAAGTTPLVISPDGTVQHFGGWIERHDDRVRFTLDGADLAVDDPQLPPSGPSAWAPGTAALLRRSVLDDVPLDPDMDSYYEDNDWCLRVDRSRAGSFRRCREAIVVHHRPVVEPGSLFVRRARDMRLLQAHARFLAKHGRVLDVGLPELVPELRGPEGFDYRAARLLLELIASRGGAWTLAQWMGGGLEPLLHNTHARVERLTAETRRLEERERDLEQQARELGAHLAKLDEQVTRAWILEQEAEVAAAEKDREIAWLTERHETLVLIEHGGWWRLRGRLLLVLRIAGRVRRALRRGGA